MSDSVPGAGAGPLRPVVALDVDGVLAPFAQTPGAARALERRGFRRLVCSSADGTDYPVWLSEQLGAELAELASSTGCELVWATSWNAEAASFVAPAMGLPEMRVVEVPRPGRLVHGWTGKCVPLARAVGGLQPEDLAETAGCESARVVVPGAGPYPDCLWSGWVSTRADVPTATRCAPARPLAWVDDATGRWDGEWARLRSLAGASTLLLRPCSDYGLSARHLRELKRWALEHSAEPAAAAPAPARKANSND